MPEYFWVFISDTINLIVPQTEEKLLRSLSVQQNVTYRMLAIRIANYPDNFDSSGKFVDNSTKINCLEIIGYRIKYSTVLWLLELNIRRGGRRYIL